jgi:hypothetical protein
LDTRLRVVSERKKVDRVLSRAAAEKGVRKGARPGPGLARSLLKHLILTYMRRVGSTTCGVEIGRKWSYSTSS